MIKRPEIELLKYHTVRIQYRTSKKKITRTITGTLRSIGLRNVHIETVKASGREYRIPIRSVKNISEVLIE